MYEKYILFPNKFTGGYLTVSTLEQVMRRFLMHVPPKRFVRIRHYKILASRNKKKHITLCRNLLGCRACLSQLKDKTGLKS